MSIGRGIYEQPFLFASMKHQKTPFESALLTSYPESRYQIEHLTGTGRYTISRRGSGEVVAVYTGVKD